MSIWDGSNIVAQGRYLNGADVAARGGKASYSGGVGVVNVTLEQGLTANEGSIWVSPEFTATNISVGIAFVSPTVRQVVTKDATNANINCNFSWIAFQLPGS